jgi:Glycosyl hydrolases family 38 N-terminal domain.
MTIYLVHHSHTDVGYTHLTNRYSPIAVFVVTKARLNFWFKADAPPYKRHRRCHQQECRQAQKFLGGGDPMMLTAFYLLGFFHGFAEPVPSPVPRPASPVLIYIAPMSHLDIDFTAPPSQVAEKMRRTIAQAIAFADADPNFVWTVETFWQLERWLETNPPEPQRQRLLQLLRSGRFELGAAYANPHSNAMSAFLLDWLFRLPRQWAGEHQIPMTTAILNDVPGHPIDLPHFLARQRHPLPRHRGELAIFTPLAPTNRQHTLLVGIADGRAGAHLDR